MEARLTPANRLDQLDAEQFRDMLASEPFQRVMARIRAELERARESCAGEDDELKLRRAQGAAAALRMALGLPEQILAEIKNGTVRKSR